MSNTAPVPAGWYPDPHEPTLVRWWDGVQWTDRTQTPYTSTGAAGGLSAPAGAATGTWQVWAINALFALQLVVSVIYIATIDWSAYMAYSVNPTPGDISAMSSIFNVGYFAVLIVSLIGYLGTAALAFSDSKELDSRGVQRPFHWAWTFVPSYGSMVYIIGRSVVVKRRTGGGLGPLWAYIAIFVIGFIASLFASFAMINSMMSEITTF